MLADSTRIISVDGLVALSTVRAAPPLVRLDRCAARRRPPSSNFRVPPPLKTWPSFDAEGVGIAFWRLVEAFVLMNGRRGQRGDVIGQTGTMVLRLLVLWMVLVTRCCIGLLEMHVQV